MKKRIFFILILLFLVSGTMQSEKKINDNEINKIKIYFISFDVTTSADVLCENSGRLGDLKSIFDGYILKKKTIKDKPSIRKFIELINVTEYSSKPATANIKLKVEFYKNKKKRHILCMDQSSMFFDGETLKFSNDIFYEVLKMCDYYKIFQKNPKSRR